MAFLPKAAMAIAVAACFAAPAAAEWMGQGNFEPDNAYDSAEWMFQDAPGIGESRIYFNVMTSSQYQTSGGKPAINPNVGALHTQIEPVASERHTAFLGVWKDCNGDGYIGMAETAVREYSSALLSSSDACPPVTGPVVRWTAGAHNYNGWVSEFVPLSAGATNTTDLRVHRDDDIRIWGDFHRPDERPFQRSCTLFPQARGTYHDTGGLINWFDCRVDLLGPSNDAMTLIGDPAGLRFSDEDDAHSGTLGGFTLGGDEDSENAAVRTLDCEGDPALHVHSGDTANQTGLGSEVPANLQNISFTQPGIGPSLGDLESPTLAGQVNQTNEEHLDDCDTSNDFGHDLYSGTCFVTPCVGETDFNGVNPNNKTEADWNFGFTTVSRGTAPFSALPGLQGPAGAASDAGLLAGGSRWLSDSIWVSKAGPRSIRADLQSGGVAIAPAYWLSFYAHVGATTLARGFALPGTNEGIYGSWHCEDNDVGIHNGWNCDPSVWYINPDGSFPNNAGDLAKPGWTYHLRDVDCYDGRIGDTGIAVEPAFYGDQPCT